VSTISGTMDGVWNGAYETINIANGAIKYIPTISFNDATKQKQLIAEAKFFRAYNYFYLVKTFGDVPLVTEPTEALDNLEVERTPIDQVYGLIESDLKEAVDALPSKTFAANNHRITKYVAAMTLANVYFQQGKNTEAAQYAKEVINSPHNMTPNSDLSMNSAYNQLRKQTTWMKLFMPWNMMEPYQAVHGGLPMLLTHLRYRYLAPILFLNAFLVRLIVF